MKEKVQISGWGDHGQNKSTTSITLSGIPKDQQEKVEGVTFGQYWMTVTDGKIVFSPAREPLPRPVEDEEMLPFWRRHKECQAVMHELVFDHEERNSLPSFMIKHLCGHNYTPENYRLNAEILEGYGFVCMRSPRGEDGRFWEMWYLPGTWAAKGDLAVEIEGKYDGVASKKKEIDDVVKFLCRNVSFGQLDVVIQRAAMSIE